MKYLINSFLILTLSTQSTLLQAHDFWLEPIKFHVKVNQLVEIDIRVGSEFVGETMPNLPSRYVDFSYTTANSLQAITEELGRYPAGIFTPQHRGTYSIAYQSKFSEVELDADKFNQYLKDEGLEHIIDYRQQHKQSQYSVKEQFSRYAKTIVQVSNNHTNTNTIKKNNDFSQQNFNYPLEIIALQNPYQLQLGDDLNIKVLMQQKPLANTLIIAFTKNKPNNKQKIRTDEQGIAKIKLHSNGIWLLKTVAMKPYTIDDFQWESLWASLTFELENRMIIGQ